MFTPRVRRTLLALALAGAVLPLTDPALAADGLRDPWFLAGANPKEYKIGLDDGVRWAGKPSAYIRSIGLNLGDDCFGTLMQQTSAVPFRGKTIRWTAMVKTVDVQDWAGLWARIDAPQQPGIRFDNMQDRKIMGSVDWTKYEITLDVPPASTHLSFGIHLGGRGTAYINGVALDEVVPPYKPPVSMEFETK